MRISKSKFYLRWCTTYRRIWYKFTISLIPLVKNLSIVLVVVVTLECYRALVDCVVGYTIHFDYSVKEYNLTAATATQLYLRSSKFHIYWNFFEHMNGKGILDRFCIKQKYIL